MPLIPFRQMARTHPPSPSYAVREEGRLRSCSGGGREGNPLERTTYAAQTSGPAPAHPGRRAARPHSKQPRPRPALVTAVTPPPRRALVSEGRDGATTAPMASAATTPDRGLAMYGYDHPASTLIRDLQGCSYRAALTGVEPLRGEQPRAQQECWRAHIPRPATRSLRGGMSIARR